MMEYLGAEDVTPVVVALVVSTAAIALFFFTKNGQNPTITTETPPTTSRGDTTEQGGSQGTESVLEQMSQTERLQLQSRVANAKCAEDIYVIFDDFDILHNLDLRGACGQDATPDQAFRDLVRDKITLNDDCVLIAAEHTSSPAVFRKYFHGLVLDQVRNQHLQTEDLCQEKEGSDNKKLSKKAKHKITNQCISKHQCEENQQALATHLCW